MVEMGLVTEEDAEGLGLFAIFKSSLTTEGASGSMPISLTRCKNARRSGAGVGLLLRQMKKGR